MSLPQKKTTSSDRLIAGFQRIVEFVEVNGRRPQNDADREERSLYNQLKGILSDSAKKERCRPYDSVGLLDDGNKQVVSEPPSAYGLTMQTSEQQLEAIFADPLFDDVGQASGSLFDLPDYMKRKLEERREADYVAQRVKCEDFGSFETGFKAVHAGLKSGRYRLIKFKEAHVAPGRYFVEDGILVYIAGMDQIEKTGTEERMAVHVASMKTAWSRASICRRFARTCIAQAIRYKTCRL